LRIITVIILLAATALLIYGLREMPDWGDPNSPAATHISPKYVQTSMEETHTPNIVTSVLADFRGYDTMGETTVIFSAGMACILLLRKWRKGRLL